MQQLQALKRRLIDEFYQLPMVRRRILFGSLAVTVCFGIYSAIGGMQEHFASEGIRVERRQKEMQTLAQMVGKYQQRREQLDTMQQTFERSQMTFEQVTAELDRIVKESIGSDNYDLKKSEGASTVGVEYDKQEFTLRIRSLTLSQLINLLYRLEEGKTPLFLGKVDIVKSPRPDDFGATLEVSSIRKRAAA